MRAVAALLCAASLALASSCASHSASVAIAPADTAVAQEIKLHTATGDISGTLLRPPSSPQLCPQLVVLIVAGSGPTDRNGNSPLGVSANSYKILADSLARRGFASVRYDKRGVVASSGAMPLEDKLRFDDYVADAVAWIDTLARDPRFSRVAVIGHSEGALIAVLAAERTRTKVAGVVSLSGAGRRIDVVLAEQLRAAQPPLTPAALATADSLLAELVAGRQVPIGPKDFPPMLWLTLFRPSIQPYLISWFRYDPADVLARLAARHVRVQVVQGTTDIQVSVADARRLAAAAGVQPMLIEGMNHVLKIAPAAAAADRAANAATYTKPDLPIPGALVAAIASFLHDAPK